ncbi:energy transducer TonB [Lutibacter sp.]|uniref:energy transducer TonB n=1 Tax=Lutibacter sp. TaxID=1925666 RepID=UPI001A25FC16|nr:energy transducer TonB [Lutibacter sp.]MBI9040536.1 energy transducer TonB [Lutibacter sp.]
MINFILQVVLFQALFLAVYDFFLQKETFFKWNRFYLLLTPVLAFVIPFLKFESLQKSVPIQYVEQLPTVFLNPQAVILQTVKIESSMNYFEIGFYVGIVLFLILFLIKLFKIIQLIVTNEVVKSENFKLVLLNKKKSAFSFFNYIFIKRDFVKQKVFSIIQHEMVHCKQLHTLDLLFFEFLKIAMWFNPLIYVYQNRITLLHEYISDAEVVKKTDKHNYFNTILSQTFNVENISFINQFFKHSLIKKRIAMITKNKSQKIKQLKYLLMIPLIGGMLVLSSFEDKKESNIQALPIIDEVISSNEIIENVKVEESSKVLKKNDTLIETLDVPFSEIENVPVFPGCTGTEEELKKCLQEGITNHVNKNFNTNLTKELKLEPGVQRIYVMFKIDKDGNISDIKSRASHKALEDEAIRVVSLLPKMTPGKHKSNFVNVKYALPIAFKVDGKIAKDEIPKYTKKRIDSLISENVDVDLPFAVIENVPVFPGCEGSEEELKACIQENITNHVAKNFNSGLAKTLGLKPGIKRVFVIFKINKEGNITDVQARAPHENLEEEAVRVVSSLPKMIPGKYGGQAVGVKYSLPIAFKVD